MAVTTRAMARKSASPQNQSVSSGASSRRTSASKTNESPSDGEGRVRPTRKKLAKARITTTEKSPKPEGSENSVAVVIEQKATNGVRGRGLRRKRSFEEVGEGQENTKGTENVSKLSRKRSRDVKGSGERDDSASGASVSGGSEQVRSGDEEDTSMTTPPKAEETTTDLAEEMTAPLGEEPEQTLAQESAAIDAETSAVTLAKEPAAILDHEPENTLAHEPETTVAHESATTSAEDPLTDSPAKDVEVSLPEEPTTPTQEVGEVTQAEDDAKKSPPNKRNRDQFTEDHEITNQSVAGESSTSAVATEPNDGLARPPSVADADDQAPDSKRHQDSFLGSDPTENTENSTPKIPASSGFADASSKSPFAALSPKSPTALPQTSPSAFASSGFAALAGSSQSPFGALGSQSVFQKPKEAPTPTLFGSTPASGFAALGTASKSPFATTGPSVFGGSHSGFGQLTNGFGSGSSFGGPLRNSLSGFASSGTTNVIGAGSKPAKPFGVLNEDEDEEADASGAESGGETKAVSAAEEQKDERFYEQEVETGEEDEVTEFKGRGKLYMMTDKQWKERGTGDFKVNSKITGYKVTARFLMRVDGSHRVVLNSPIKKDLLVEDPQRGPPRGRTAVFLGFVDGQIVTLQLRMRDNVQTLALHDVVKKLQDDM